MPCKCQLSKEIFDNERSNPVSEQNQLGFASDVDQGERGLIYLPLISHSKGSKSF